MLVSHFKIIVVAVQLHFTYWRQC